MTRFSTPADAGLVGLLLLLLAAPCAATQAGEEDYFWIWHAAEPPAAARQLAVLLDHLELRGEEIKVRQRRRALYVAPNSRVTPVVHVQIDPARPAVLGTAQTEAIVKAVRTAAGRSTSGWVQLDFEVTRPHREYFLRLVTRLRRELPPATRLSVTTQAHWCNEPELMARIDADEVVPMFFHTGDDLRGWWARLRDRNAPIAPRCREGSAGFATQQAPPDEVRTQFGKRYWFSLVSWQDFRQEQ